MKAILKKSISLVICVALMLTAIPMMLASAEDTAIPEPLLLATGKGDVNESGAGIYHPGGYTTADKTFDAQATQNASWVNNLFVRDGSKKWDLSAYNTITLSFWYEKQEAYEYWKDYLFFVVSDGTNVARVPIDTTFTKPAVYPVTINLDYVASKGVDISSIYEFGVRSMPNAWWWSGQLTNPNAGFFSDDESAPDFHFSLTNMYARYIPESDYVFSEGNYGWYGAECVNRDYISWNNTLTEAVDISGYDYLSYKFYISDVEALKAEVNPDGTPLFHTIYFRIGASAGEMSSFGVAADKLVSGYNEIHIPISKVAYAGNVQWLWMHIEPHAGNGNVPSKPYVIGVVDIKAVDVVVPEAEADVTVMDNSHALDLWSPNENRDYITYHKIYDNTFDLSGADHVEFDVYVSDIEKMKAQNAGQYCFRLLFSTELFENFTNWNYSDQITKNGWNHVVLNLDKNTGSSGTIDISAVNGTSFYMSSMTTNTEYIWIQYSNVSYSTHSHVTDESGFNSCECGLIGGDANFDGVVDVLDLVRIKKALAGQVTLGADYADCNRSGTFDIDDIVYLRKYILTK